VPVGPPVGRDYFDAKKVVKSVLENRVSDSNFVCVTPHEECLGRTVFAFNWSDRPGVIAC
jgi:hypothetical protein